MAYLPSPGIVKLRITAFGNNEAELSARIDDSIENLKKLIPKYIFGYEKDRIEEVVGQLLKEKGSSLSLAESCTGGNIAHLITGVSGSSNYFKGSVVAYSNDIKQQVLNVDPKSIQQNGAVSKQVVEQMATGVRNSFKSDYAIATSGVAGPTGGTKQKPVGTVWIAVAYNEGVVSKKFNFGNNRGRNIQISSLSALNMLRLVLLN